jgi:hypothetical protein
MVNFTEKLVKDIDERQLALTEIERVLFTQRYNLSKRHFEIFSVQSIAMIYSIWEGFIQTAFNLFIDEINIQRIYRDNIQDVLYVYEVENSFKQLHDYPKKINKKLSFLQELRLFFNDGGIAKIPSGINTQNNVSFEVLNSILRSFGLEPFAEHWKQYKYPNPTLKDSLKTFLRYRNSVAHGGDISSEEKVTQEIYERYKNLVIDLMYEILFRINSNLENCKYKKLH